MKKILPKNYRKLVVERLAARGKVYHPNTVRNVLHGSPNIEVATELLALFEEQQKSVDKFRRHAKAIVAEAA